MSPEVREAIESAQTVGSDDIFVTPRRRWPLDRLRAVLLAIVQELPEEMTMRELRDELDIAENQRERL